MKVKTSISASIIIFLTILLIALIAYRAAGYVTPLLTVKSGSMVPTLNVGDVILMEPVDPKDIKVGDVIIFYKPGSDQLIVHRVVKKTNSGLYTKGDANVAVDWWVPLPYEYVVGRWTGFKIPNWLGLGYLSLFFSGEIYPPYGLLTLVGLIAINLSMIIKDLMTYEESSEEVREEDRENRAEAS